MQGAHDAFADNIVKRLSSTLHQTILEELALSKIGGLDSEHRRLQLENSDLRGLIAELRGDDRTLFTTSTTVISIDDLRFPLPEKELDRIHFSPVCIDTIPSAKKETSADEQQRSDHFQEKSSKSSKPSSAEKSSKSSKNFKIGILQQKKPPPNNTPSGNWIERLVKHPLFEQFSSTVILVDILSLSIQAQWQSYGIGVDIGLRNHDAGWNDAEKFFVAVRIALCAVYTIELLLRVFVLKLKILRSPVDFVDAGVIIAIVLELCIGQAGQSLLVFHLGRLPFLLRALKILSVIAHSHFLADLRILLRTVVGCAHGLVTLMLGLGLLIYAGGLCLTTIVFMILTTNDGLAETTQKELYENYGRFSDALFSVFESTLSSAWAGHARFMIYDVNGWLALFWCPFVLGVNFMFVKIISAITVKQVMEIAAHGQEKMAMTRIHNSKTYAGYIRQIFKAGDTSGDGLLNKEEFAEMQSHPEVMEYFEKLSLDGDEIQVLFDVLSADDGVVDFDEFLSAALKLKNSAKTIDTMQIHTDQRKMMQDVRAMRQILDAAIASRASESS